MGSSPGDGRGGRGVRVLHLTHGLPVGGKERLLVELARSGCSGGHNDEILTFDTPFRAGNGQIDADGIRVSHIQRRPGVDFDFGRKLRRFLRERGVQTVHAHNHAALFHAALALVGQRGRGCRLIATMHNRPSRPTWRARLAARWAADRADHLVCVSEQLRSWLAASGWIAGGGVLGNGVDPSAFAPNGPRQDLKAELGLRAETLLIGMVSRFASGKLQQDLVEGCRLARARGVDVAVVFAGDGATLGACRAEVRESDPVHFLGAVRDVPFLLRGLDVFALLSEHEGMPLSLLEAMACGLPAIASSVGGVPEVVSNDVGFLVPVGDAETLVDTMVQLGDASLRRAMGAAARRRVVALFSLEAAIAGYESMYRRVDDRS